MRRPDMGGEVSACCQQQGCPLCRMHVRRPLLWRIVRPAVVVAAVLGSSGLVGRYAAADQGVETPDRQASANTAEETERLVSPTREAARGKLTYKLSEGWEQWPPKKRQRIVAAMDTAVSLYNKHARFKKKLVVSYNLGTPTADANYRGRIRFGKSIGARTALHEISHTLGVGTTKKWRSMIKGGRWGGQHANRLLQSFDGPQAKLKGDKHHFWPYGLNYAREDGKRRRIRHVKLVEALCRDMQLPVLMPEPASLEAAQNRKQNRPR